MQPLLSMTFHWPGDPKNPRHPYRCMWLEHYTWKSMQTCFCINCLKERALCLENDAVCGDGTADITARCPLPKWHNYSLHLATNGFEFLEKCLLNDRNTDSQQEADYGWWMSAPFVNNGVLCSTPYSSGSTERTKFAPMAVKSTI